MSSEVVYRSVKKGEIMDDLISRQAAIDANKKFERDVE